MGDFEFTDKDGDRLQVVEMSYPGSGGERGWLFRISGREGRYASAWLPRVPAGQLAMHVWNDAEPREQLLQVAGGASIDWAIGEHTVRVEGSTAMECAMALRVTLGADGEDEDSELLTELAEMLGCEVDELAATVGELRRAIENEHASAETMMRERDARPTADQLRQAEQHAERAERRVKAAVADLETERAGRKALGHHLRELGLQDLATQPLHEIAARVAALGAENNRLREQLLPNGRAGDDLSRRVAEQLQELEALRLVDEQLHRALERERDLRRAAVERAATNENAANRYLDMLRTAREALQEARAEFVNADTEEIEAADLSSEQAALIVAKIDRALAATA